MLTPLLCGIRLGVLQVWTVVKFITAYQKPLSIFRELGEGLPIKPPGGTELLKYAPTRFASKIMMCGRYASVHKIANLLLLDPRYTAWLSAQKASVRTLGATVRSIIRDDDHISGTRLVVRVFEPCVKLLRLMDGKKGATLSKVSNLLRLVDDNLQRRSTEYLSRFA